MLSTHALPYCNPAGSAAAKSRSAAGEGGRLYDLSYTKDPFSFKVSRRGKDGKAVFDTTGTRLVFKASQGWMSGPACLAYMGRSVCLQQRPPTTCLLGVTPCPWL